MTPYRTAYAVTRICLIIVGLIGLSRGVAYLPGANSERLPGGILIITTFVPLLVWVGLWLASGALALFCSVLVKPLGTVIAIFMCIVWGVGYLASFLVSLFDTNVPGFNRDWVGGVLYLGVAGLLICGARLAIIALGYARQFTSYAPVKDGAA